MRVLYFSRDYTTHDFRFLERLAAGPFEMHFLRLEADGTPYESRPLPAAVRPVDWEGGRRPYPGPEDWFRLMPSFAQVVERLRPDLIHAGPVPSCGFMAAMLGFRPLLVMSWASDLLVDADRDGQLRWMARYALARSDMLVCDSAAVRTKAQALVPYPDERIVQFPWGIDLGAYRPGAGDSPVRKRLGWQDNRVVLSTRAWEKLHGIDVLLEAFRQAHNSDAGLRLLLLGTGSARREVREFIGRHGLADVVYCAGQVAHAEVLGHYQAADVYVSCARSDGASISLLEAMAAGLLVVVSDIPGNREWVQPGVNGWLGGDGDPSSFAAALLAAANLEEAGRAAFRERNRGLVCERADWHRNIETILVAYDRLLR